MTTDPDDPDKPEIEPELDEHGEPREETVRPPFTTTQDDHLKEKP